MSRDEHPEGLRGTVVRCVGTSFLGYAGSQALTMAAYLALEALGALGLYVRLLHLIVPETLPGRRAMVETARRRRRSSAAAQQAPRD